MSQPNDSWQPSKQGLEDIVNVLTQAHTNPSKAVFDRLESFKLIADYNKYLCFIFIHLGQYVGENVRSVAGLTLKNNLMTNFAIPKDEQNYLKQEALKVVGDPAEIIRKTGASLITTIISVGGLKGWPHVLPFLTECLSNAAAHVVSGAFSALRLICEDHALELDSDPTHPLNFLLPKFLQFFQHTDVLMRRNALDCILPFLHFLPVTLMANMQNFMAGFFFLATDPDAFIQKRIIIAFRILVDTDQGIGAVEPFLPQIMEYILCQMNGTDTELVLAASEFWRCLYHHDTVCNQVVAPHLPKILPTLLARMVYTDEDLADLGSLDEDAHIPDRPEDIRPQFQNFKQRGGGRDDDDDDGWNDFSEWTVRKCAAEGLDYLSRPFVKRFLPVFLPLVERGLQSSDWKERESSILALGCISTGQSAEMKEHLPKLIPFLFDLTRDHKPLIRSITCWVLARYSNWIIQHPDKGYFNQLVGELLTRIHDKNKEAQKAACAGLAQVSEVAAGAIEPYALAILTEFSKAFDRFQRGSLFALYDAIGAITNAMGPKINEERYLSVLLPPLLNKWDTLPDDDPTLFQLFDCLAHVAVALGKGFKQYTPPIFNRCLKIIETSLMKFVLNNEDPVKYPETPEFEFLTCPMDLLGSVCEALGADIGDYVRNSTLIPLLFEVCKNISNRPDICQSAYALVGDLARRSPETFETSYIAFLQIFLNGTYFTRAVGMCNNSFWAAGELIVAMIPTKPAVELPAPLVQSSLIEKFMIRSIEVMDDPDAYEILETVAVVIGRICWVCPLQSIRFLQAMNFRYYLRTLRNVADEREKADSLRGICEVLSIDPELGVQDFALVCELLGSCDTRKRELSPDLINAIGTLLHKYKNSAGELWKSVYIKLPNYIKTNFRDIYNLGP